MGTLVEAAYHSDPEVSSQRWKSLDIGGIDLETIDWEKSRVLVQTATILANRGIEPAGPVAQRIIERFDWTLGEKQLENVRPLIVESAKDGVPVMVFKGGAMFVSGYTDFAPRLMADIDILIKPADIDSFLDIAERLGWKSKWPLSRTEFKDCLRTSRHSLPLASDGKADTDLHTSALLLNRCPDHDEFLWKRSVLARSKHDLLSVPSASDMLVLTLGHGLLSAHRPLGIWVGDAIALIESGDVDWDIFLDEIERRDLAVFAYTALEYIRQKLERSVPEYVLTSIAAQIDEPFIGEFLGHIKAPHATSREIRVSWGCAASRRATKWQSRVRNTSLDVEFLKPDIGINSSWNDATRNSASKFTVKLPESSSSNNSKIVLEVRLSGEATRATVRWEVALLCFDFHVSELDRWCNSFKDRILNFFRRRQIIQLCVDTAIISAYSLKRLQLEFLSPDTLAPADVKLDAVEYRWRK